MLGGRSGEPAIPCWRIGGMVGQRHSAEKGILLPGPSEYLRGWAWTAKEADSGLCKSQRKALSHHTYLSPHPAVFVLPEDSVVVAQTNRRPSRAATRLGIIRLSWFALFSDAPDAGKCGTNHRAPETIPAGMQSRQRMRFTAVARGGSSFMEMVRSDCQSST